MEFVFFSGKGGVGKTTCAAGTAIAETARGRRVLLASIDPAHSLGDVLSTRVGAVPSRIAVGQRSLRAVAIDAPRALARWLAPRRRALAGVIERGTWFDRGDVEALLDLSLPGIDELAALADIIRLAETRRTDLVVVDTAPTGHTLRLLSGPATVAAVAEVLDALQEHDRALRRQFGRGAGRAEAAERLIVEIAREAERIDALLRDRSRTSFACVVLPEALALEETRDAVRLLRQRRIPLARLIANRVVPDGPPCALCDPRRRGEREILADIRRVAGSLPMQIVEDFAEEPRGVRALARVGRMLGSDRKPTPVRGNRAAGARAASRVRRSGPRSGIAPIESLGHARLLLFGGKGGVGKTTVAAAAALTLAAAHPSRRIVLISTDPAHSLGDVFDRPIGDRPAPIRGAPRNLHVRELDAAAAFGLARGDLERAIDELTSLPEAVRPGLTVSVHSASVPASRVFELAPPGIDELFGLLTLVHATASASDLVVVDTAPTGHTLRLLAMPEVAAEWVRALLRVLLKYRAIAKPGGLAQELVDLSQSIRGLTRLLHDPAATVFVPVARAAEVPRLETERLLASLRSLELSVPAVVINAMTPTVGACPRCRRMAAAERPQAALLRRACASRGGCAIIQAPLVAPPPRGVAALARWAGEWVA